MESKCISISNNNNNKEYKYNIVFWFCGGGIGAVGFFIKPVWFFVKAVNRLFE
jgi:hypothetical protein